MMAYDADGEDVDLLDHLLSKQRRHAERRSSSRSMVPAIKMLKIGLDVEAAIGDTSGSM